MKKLVLTLIAIFATAIGVPASAQQVLNFTYNAGSGNVITGSVFGALAPDGNNFFANSTTPNFALNGVPITFSNPITSSASAVTFVDPAAAPQLSVDGKYFDYYYGDTNVSTYFAISAASPYSVIINQNFSELVSPQGTFSNTAFNPANFSASVSNVGGAPEPATWAMLIMGFGVAGCALRRRRAHPGRTYRVAFA